MNLEGRQTQTGPRPAAGTLAPERFGARRLLAVAVLGVVAALARPPASRAAPGAEEEQRDREERISHVYLQHCATCHGDDGLGTNRGPSLAGVGRASLHYMLSTGRMPLEDPKEPLQRGQPAFSEETIAALVDYVAALAAGDDPGIPDVVPGHGDLAEGFALFRLNCAACHAWSGQGGGLLYRKAPAVQPATPVQAAEAIRVGPATMPRFPFPPVSDGELNSLVAYLEYLESPRHPGGLPLGYLGPVAEGAVAVFVGLGGLLVVARVLGGRR